MKRTDLIKALGRLQIETGSIACLGCGHEHNCSTQGCALIREAVEELSAADVRPVVRGRWEWRHRHRGGFRRVTGEDDFGVSHTITVDERYEIDDPYCPSCGKLNESIFLNYCPNCGADMREA